jgi:hypothetical protein
VDEYKDLVGRTCDHCGKRSVGSKKGGITWYRIEMNGATKMVKAHPLCFPKLRDKLTKV